MVSDDGIFRKLFDMTHLHDVASVTFEKSNFRGEKLFTFGELFMDLYHRVVCHMYVHMFIHGFQIFNVRNPKLAKSVCSLCRKILFGLSGHI